MKSKLCLSVATATLATMIAMAPAHAIVPNDNHTSASIQDPADQVNGIGMFLTESFASCTGTLINPRTVIFAAHCVNSRPESDYSDGTHRSVFAFGGNSLAGLRAWFFGDRSQSHPAEFAYAINKVAYRAETVDIPELNGFLEADVAVATLESPVTSQFDGDSGQLTSTVPYWAILFSPLPSPEEIDPVTGTGYHVDISGYGSTGSGSLGATNVGFFRRRSAENMLGGLTSLNTIFSFVFEPGSTDNLNQNVYAIDFDDPLNNGGAGEGTDNDFDVFPDDALPLEGSTAPGDSGSALILDAENNDITDENLVLGVLSGGLRFFGDDQPFSSYGTVSFFQPLYLYWQYIAENNPYRYVSAKAGDGDWGDASHWESLIDPAYRIIDADGNIVNGVPTTPELARGPGDDAGFGNVCEANCIDVATGEIVDRPGTPADDGDGDDAGTAAGGVQISDNRGRNVTVSAASTNDNAVGDDTATTITVVNRARLTADGAFQAQSTLSETIANAIQAQGGQPSGTIEDSTQAQADQPNGTVEDSTQAQEDEAAPQETEEGEALPAPTIDNGLPGAENFVPNNVEATVDNKGSYFDVTLANAGTTTMGITAVIDRLAVTGDAVLDVTEEGSLTSLIDITQRGGDINVDGLLETPGDFLLTAGTLSGTGTIRANFLTNVAGVISPAGAGTIGELTLEGNYVGASASVIAIDIGMSGQSDVFRVANDQQLIDAALENGLTEEDVTTGTVNAGGTIFLTGTSDFNNLVESNYTVLYAQSGITGDFDVMSAGVASALVTTEVTVNQNSVDIRVLPQDLADVLDGDNPIYGSFAQIIDQNRGNAAFDGLFSELYGIATVDEIRTFLDSAAPTGESASRGSARSGLNVYYNVMNGHLSNLTGKNSDDRRGRVAVIGRPLEIVSALSAGYAVNGSAAEDNDETKYGSEINEDLAVYMHGGFIEGNVRALPGLNRRRSVDDNFDGFYLGAGLDYYASDNLVYGGAVYYSSTDGTTSNNQSNDADVIYGSIYGQYRTESNIILDANIGFGNYKLKTRRRATLGGTEQLYRTSDNGFAYNGQIRVGKELSVRGNSTLTPRLALRYSSVSLSDVEESGGIGALRFERPDYDSFQLAGGIEWRTDTSKAFQVWTTVDYVHEFDSDVNAINANLVGGTGAGASFGSVDTSTNWGELGLGMSYKADSKLILDLSVQTSLGRTDVESQVYSGRVTYKF